jgi:hypothetical protein
MEKNDNWEYEFFKKSCQESKTYNLTLEVADEVGAEKLTLGPFCNKEKRQPGVRIYQEITPGIQNLQLDACSC